MRALSQLISKKLSRSLSSASSTSSPCETLTSSLKSSSSSSSSRSCSSHSFASRLSSDLISPPHRDGRSVIGSPWRAVPTRGLKVNGTNLRAGNVIEKKDRIYEVLKVDHSHEGRGKATIKVTKVSSQPHSGLLDGHAEARVAEMSWVHGSGLYYARLEIKFRCKVELRDVDCGNKVIQRFGTDEAVEKVFVEAKSYIYMCTDRDGKILLMDPDTLDQLEVHTDLFRKKAKYLQDDMKVKVEVYNGIPLSASVPKHATCIVKDAQPPVKGIGVTPREKIAVLENGLSIKVPAHVVVGDTIVIDTEDDSYVKRGKA